MSNFGPLRSAVAFIVLAVLSMAIAAPSAQANPTAVPVPQADPLFTYSYLDKLDNLSWTTAPISAVTMSTTVPAADLTATSTSGFLGGGCLITFVVLDDLGVGDSVTEFSSSSCLVTSATNLDSFPLADYSKPGTYVSALGNTLIVTATPEPNSVALILFGAGVLLFVTRKTGKKVGHPLSA
jgi:hypothetical protein